MTYVVTENCIKCKYMDCVEVCPVDCFYEGENMLVIHPDECIDCGVCEPECPAEAIKPDTEPGLDKWLKINTEFASIWPNITVKRDAMPEAKEMEIRKGALEAFRILGGRGWGRVDFLMDEAGNHYYLEVNTAPGMTDHSLVPMGARVAGMEYPALVRRVLELAAND